MKRSLRVVGPLLTVASYMAFVVGCSPAPAKPGRTTANSSGAAEHEHDEGEEGHDHEHGHDHAHGEHGHPSEGPHHGHLIELGNEEYHAELTHDDESHTITIYLLDGDAKGAVGTAESEVTVNLVVNSKPMQFVLPAVPQADDGAGESSKFELVSEELCDALEAEEAKGRLNVSIAGKPFTGAIEHHAHGEHDHDEMHEEAGEEK